MPEPRIAYFRDAFCPIENANVNIRCKALNYGLGVFEGIRGYADGKGQVYLFRLHEHYDRLLKSCRICRLRTSRTVQEMAALTVELGRRNDVCQDVYFRPIFFVGDETLSPTLPETPAVFAIWCMPLDDYLAGDGVTAMVTSWQRVGDNMIPPRAKPIAAYLNSALARADAKDAGCDEAVFLTNLGYVAEGSAEHVFIVRNGRLITPPTEDNNLDGITRRTLLEVVPKHLGHQVEVRHVGRTELYIADEMFFVGTGAQVTPVLSVDRRPLGDGRPGPITRRVRELYGRVVRNQVPEYGAWCTPVYG